MAYTIERIDDAPIILITITFPIEDAVQETIDSDAAVDAAAQDIAGKYYRIADMTAFELTFMENAQWLAEQKEARPGSINDPRVVTLSVAGTQSAKDAAEWAKQEQYGGTNIRIFETIEDALAFARENDPNSL